MFLHDREKDRLMPETALMVHLRFPGWDCRDVNALSCSGCQTFKDGVCPGHGLRCWEVVGCILKQRRKEG
ncbi:hypothetical protein ES705_38086 [subsurface metagenome]